ncbi:Ig-like domain-containing protein [Marinicauda sp. Alg238-R41]|uniref:Ig-like domain-containing protein n=1 Tax=Marinicauda sp. Alg238-R41 TaxID=2993447 RepID=UPI0022E5F3B1|nr:Ig-like domain-containing protein [Marinicauda sp. Alg238-R41]
MTTGRSYCVSANGSCAVTYTYAQSNGDDVTVEFDILPATPTTLRNARATGLGVPDTVSPRISSLVRHSPATETTDADALTWRVTFDETVTGVGDADFSVSGTTATIASVTDQGSNRYDVTASGGDLASLEGTVTLSVLPNGIQDSAGNTLTNTAPTGTNQPSYQVSNDTTPPSVTLSSTASDPVSGAFPVTITFSESVTGFAAGDLSLTNATASAFSGTGAVYTVTITPSADGQVTVGVAANVAQDGAGNQNTAATDLTRTADATAPSVTLSSTASDPVSGAFPVTVTFSESVTGFAAGDLSLTNASASAFSGTGAVYTVTITPSANGQVTVGVPANVAQDGAGNQNTAAADLTRTADATPPSVTLSSTASDPVSGAFPVTITFSEAVTGFAAGDLSLTNATASAFSGTGAVYTVTITPSADGQVTVGVPANAAQDAAGNQNTAATDLTRTSDTTAPSVTLSSAASDPVSGSFPVTITFSESVTGFAAGDLSLTNATASAFSGTGAVYTVTITPSADGQVTVGVPANVAQDGAGNQNTAATDLTRTADATAPSVTLSSTASDPVSGSFPVTITFSESVTGFAAGDLSLTNATASAFSGTGAVYTVTITPSADGSLMVELPAGAATDVAGNANSASNTLSRTVDKTVPAVTLSTSAPDFVTGPFSVSIAFSEGVSGLQLADLALTNATASNLNGAGKSYTVDIAPDQNGMVSVNLPAAAVVDGAGNANSASNTITRELDTSAPAVTLTSNAPDPVSGTFEVAIEFSEEVSGLELTHLSLVNASAENLAGNGTSYTVDVTPVADGEVTVALPVNAVQDGAGNGNAASNILARKADGSAPELTIALPGAEISGPFTASLSFSEDVTGFEAGDIEVVNGVVSDFSGSAAEYTVLVTPDTVGRVDLFVRAGAAADAAGNANGEASASIQAVPSAEEITLTLASDVDDPESVLGTATLTNPGRAPLRFEASTDAAWLDIDPLYGTIPSAGAVDLKIALNALAEELEPGDHTATITITESGEAGPAGPASLGRAAAGRTVLVEFAVSVSVEVRNGDLTLVATTPSAPGSDTPFAYTSDLAAFQDLILTPSAGRASASVPDVRHGAYTITQNLPAGWRVKSIECAGDSDSGSTFDVETARATIDLDPGESLVCTFENVRDEDAVRIATQRAIRNFMIRRADRLIASAPALSRRFAERSATGRGTFGADVDGSGRYQLTFAGSLSGMRNAAAAQTPEIAGVTNYERPFLDGWDIWLAAQVAGVSDDRAGEDAESDFGVAQLGIDYRMGEDVILGLLAQYDWMDESAREIVEEAGAISGARVEGDGWMAGPYAVWRIQDSLVFDALAMYGGSDSRVDPLGLYRDEFETDRFMLRANLTGQFAVGPWRVRPQAGVTHFEETQNAYTDSLGNLIPDQSIAIGRFRAGPEIAWRHQGEGGGWLELNTSLRAVWDYQTAELLNEAGELAGGDENLRADASFGISSRLPGGITMRLGAGISGLGVGDFHATTGRFEIRIPFGAPSRGGTAARAGFAGGGRAGLTGNCNAPGRSGFEQIYQRSQPRSCGSAP